MRETSVNTLDFSAGIQPLPDRAKFEDPAYNIWCGSMVAGDDHRFHLFYSRWPRALGHLAWATSSEVAYAVAEDPLGPYRHVGSALPFRGQNFWDGMCTHNPTVLRHDGRYYIYYMGNTGDGVNGEGLNWTHRNNQRIGVAVAEQPSGPWERYDKPLLDVSPDEHAPDALLVSNPSVVHRPDGSFLMIYKAVGKAGKMPFGGPVVHLTATSDSPLGPFRKDLEPIFTREGISFAAEDPFVWHGEGGYWAIVKDMGGYFTGCGQSLALFHSNDGLRWKCAPKPLVSKLEIRWEDGRCEPVAFLERPQLYFERGEPKVLFCAAAYRKDGDGSFNLHLPLKGA